MVFLGPVWIVAVVLGVAGVGKIVRPSAVQPALRTLRLPDRPVVVRALGILELGLAVLTIGRGGPLLLVLLAGCYLALAAAAVSLWRAPASSHGCGCFGRSSAPAGAIHVVLDVAAAAVAAGGAASGVGSLADAWPRLPAAGAAHLVLVLTGSVAFIALMTVLPETRLAARRPAAADPRVHLFGPTITRRAAPALAGAGEGRS